MKCRKAIMPTEMMIIGGFSAFLFSLFGWMFKNTATKASDAMAISIDLKRRVGGLEVKIDELQSIRISVAKLEIETKNIDQTLKRIERHILKEVK